MKCRCPGCCQLRRSLCAVYNRYSADNAIDFWNNYDPVEVDRELRYAEAYGMNTSYYNNTTFTGTRVKTSITPALSFDLNTYQGTNSPDASAGVLSTGYGIRWVGEIEDAEAAQTAVSGGDPFIFFLTSDDVARLWIGSTEVINKQSPGLATLAGQYKLTPNQPVCR